MKNDLLNRSPRRGAAVRSIVLAGAVTSALVCLLWQTDARDAAAAKEASAYARQTPVASHEMLTASAMIAHGERPRRAPDDLLLCQATTPFGSHLRRGFDSARDGCQADDWEQARLIEWGAFAQGEYVAHARTAHVPEYRLRVDDLLEFVFRVTRDETSGPYELNVGDELSIESFTDKELSRSVVILPDGTISMRLVGQVQAARKTVDQLRADLEKLYEEYYQEPSITVTPLKVNTKLEDLRATVDSRFGSGGQARVARLTPEGTIALPAVGSVPAQGLTLSELKRELDERYRAEVEGVEVTPVLLERAPRFVYVLGEVRTPGRYTLEGPTTAMQAISLGGGWNVGANVRQVVVFRRGDDWRLMATMLDLRGALYGKRPGPVDEIWLNDSDIVLVPKSPILVWDEFISLVFTNGIYGVVPFQGASVSFAKMSTL